MGQGHADPASSKMPKWVATLDSKWLAIKMPNNDSSSFRRSTLRVSSMIGSEVRETTHA
jgi:hypothetical protein